MAEVKHGLNEVEREISPTYEELQKRIEVLNDENGKLHRHVKLLEDEKAAFIRRLAPGLGSIYTARDPMFEGPDGLKLLEMTVRACLETSSFQPQEVHSAIKRLARFKRYKDVAMDLYFQLWDNYQAGDWSPRVALTTKLQCPTFDHRILELAKERYERMGDSWDPTPQIEFLHRKKIDWNVGRYRRGGTPRVHWPPFPSRTLDFLKECHSRNMAPLLATKVTGHRFSGELVNMVADSLRNLAEEERRLAALALMGQRSESNEEEAQEGSIATRLTEDELSRPSGRNVCKGHLPLL